MRVDSHKESREPISIARGVLNEFEATACQGFQGDAAEGLGGESAEVNEQDSERRQMFITGADQFQQDTAKKH